MNPRLPRFLTAGTTLTALVAAAAVTVLSGCVMVPVDSRTGQPVNYAGARTAGTATVPLTLTARLYPLNDQASRAGMLTATVVDKHSGRGSFSLSYQGDLLQGEATRGEGGQRGVANAFSPKGLTAQCDYVITGPGIGTGACVFSDGAHYQMHFGG